MADITRDRSVTARRVLADGALPSGYPHRLVVVWDGISNGYGDLLAAVELLEDQGDWTLVNLAGVGATRIHALLRRR
jgi:hypothetical protein